VTPEQIQSIEDHVALIARLRSQGIDVAAPGTPATDIPREYYESLMRCAQVMEGVPEGELTAAFARAKRAAGLLP
jgi:hypothetical protein